MAIIEFLGFSVSILGAVICGRFVLPCFIIPHLSATLENAEQSLAHAVAAGAIPEANEYRVDFEILAGQFARMRIESHRSPGLFPQIRLVVRHGFTCRLYSLTSRVKALRLKVEVAMDERRLAVLATPRVVVRARTPAPAGDVAMPIPELTRPVTLLVH